MHLEEVRDDEVSLALSWLLLNCTVHLIQSLLGMADVALADPDTTISCLQHLRVIVAISDSNDFEFEVEFGQLYHLSLLAW